jgi:uncharacterized NAD(P)/FAD-binding protein YdhS
MFRRVAIIGGGAAAAALLGKLLERPPPEPLHVDWYTGGRAPVRGVAYGTRSERHLLNVRAASMGMFAHQPGGFLDFMRRRDPTVAGTDFLPRRCYGDYLEAEMTRALRQGRINGHDVHIIPAQADAIVPESDHLTVVQGEANRQVDAAVLAVGALPAQPLAGVSAATLASTRYVVDPWELLNDVEAQSEAPGKVVLIGLGLTAVDVLLELSARWPRTRFVAISRHGLLPEAHQHAASATSDDGSALVEAMRDAPEIRRWLELVREAIGTGHDWRTVIDSLRPHTPTLWGELPHAQRARFLRHANWAWQRARHRMPPQVHQAISKLEGEGRLQRRRGRLRSADVVGDALRLTVDRANMREMLEADMVIQTTGLDTDIKRTGHPLLRQLLINRHILADAQGLGVMAAADGRLRHPHGHWPHLFAIGSLLRGTLWESTAMPEIRQHAHRLANKLLGEPSTAARQE